MIAITGCDLPKNGSIGLAKNDGKIEEYGVYAEDYCKAYRPKAICEAYGKAQPGEIEIDALYRVCTWLNRFAKICHLIDLFLL